jgi:hypothetical protein
VVVWTSYIGVLELPCADIANSANSVNSAHTTHNTAGSAGKTTRNGVATVSLVAVLNSTNVATMTATPSPRLLSRSTNRVKKSLDRDLFRIEVAAIVDAAIAIGTASVLGSGHTVTQSQCLALADQMRKQTKVGMVSCVWMNWMGVGYHGDTA